MKSLSIKRDPSIEKYKKSFQFLIDGWATVRTAAVISETVGFVNSKKEFHDAVQSYLESNPSLDLRDFGFMYVLLKQRKYPEEIIEDIAKYFEQNAPLEALLDAYKERG
jgi:hypothetical protein